MSRSYRRPCVTDSYGTKHKQLAKRWANKRVRNYPDLVDGKMYRKVYNPWDIADYKYLLKPEDDWFGGYWVWGEYREKEYTGTYTKYKRK